MKRFEDKTVVITGGTRGLGRQMCIDFAKEGAKVAFCYKDSTKEGITLTKELESYGVKCLCFQASVSEYDKISEMMKNIVNNFGEITILINNAGILKTGPLVGMHLSDWIDMINTNLRGLYTCSKSALPYLIKSTGTIINISSFMAYRPVGAGQAVYSATKAGVIGFTRALSSELASAKIRVNAVAPGLIDTEMIALLGEKHISKILSNTSMKRLATTKEVSNMVTFLASDDAAYITGQTFVVDGGGVKSQF